MEGKLNNDNSSGSNNWRPTTSIDSGGSAMNNSGMEVVPNWRISFPENSRVKIIDKIISTLQGKLSGNPKEAINTKDMNRLKNMAYMVEANIHSAANSKEDYMRKIKATLKSIEMKRPGQVINSLPANSTGFDQKLLDSGTGFMQPSQVQARPQLLSENIQSSITECSAGFASALSTMPGLSQTGISTLGAQTTAMSNMSGISKSSLNNSTAQVFPQNTLTKSPRYEMQAKQPQQQQKQTQTQHHLIYQQQLQNLQLLSHLQHSVPQQLQPQQSFLEQKQHRQLPAHVQAAQQPMVQTVQQRTIGAEDQLEMIYQKLQSLKETYLPKLKEAKNFLIENSQKPLPPQQSEKVNQFLKTLQQLEACLHATKGALPQGFNEDKIGHLEKHIIICLNGLKTRKPAAQQHEEQRQPQLQSSNRAQSVQQASSRFQQLDKNVIQQQQISQASLLPIQHQSAPILPQSGSMTLQQNRINSLPPNSSASQQQKRTLEQMQNHPQHIVQAKQLKELQPGQQQHPLFQQQQQKMQHSSFQQPQQVQHPSLQPQQQQMQHDSFQQRQQVQHPSLRPQQQQMQHDSFQQPQQVQHPSLRPQQQQMQHDSFQQPQQVQHPSLRPQQQMQHDSFQQRQQVQHPSLQPQQQQMQHDSFQQRQQVQHPSLQPQQQQMQHDSFQQPQQVQHPSLRPQQQQMQHDSFQQPQQVQHPSLRPQQQQMQHSSFQLPQQVQHPSLQPQQQQMQDSRFQQQEQVQHPSLQQQQQQTMQHQQKKHQVAQRAQINKQQTARVQPRSDISSQVKAELTSAFKPSYVQQRQLGHLSNYQQQPQEQQRQQFYQSSPLSASSSHLLEVSSPEISQHSTPQIDKQSLKTSPPQFLKIENPIQPATSSCVVSSHSTLPTPSTLLENIDAKSASVVCSVSATRSGQGLQQSVTTSANTQSLTVTTSTDTQSLTIGTPGISASASSHSTLPTPSTLLENIDAKSASVVCSVSATRSGQGLQQSVTTSANTQSLTVTTSTDTQSLTIGTPGISASPLLGTSSPNIAQNPVSQDGSQTMSRGLIMGEKKPTERPIDRLVKMIHLMSPENFKTAASDFGAIVNLSDSMADSALAGRSKSTLGEDLVDMTRFHLQESNLMSLDSGPAAKKVKRCMNSLPVIVASSDGSLDYSPHCITDFESSKMLSTGTATAKRPRLELDRVLQPEIENVNEQLFETVVDVSDNDIDAASCEGRDGIVVKFSYNPMSFGRDKHADKSPISPLWLLIPLSYPKCSPVVLDRPPVETIKEYEGLSSKAKAMFDVSVRNLPEPMTLETLARTWDKCARNVVAQYVYERGGDSFNAQFGPWEYCTSD